MKINLPQDMLIKLDKLIKSPLWDYHTKEQICERVLSYSALLQFRKKNYYLEIFSVLLSTNFNSLITKAINFLGS